MRRATNLLPPNPTHDQRVAFALGNVELAVDGAIELGATREEVDEVIETVFLLSRAGVPASTDASEDG